EEFKRLLDARMQSSTDKPYRQDLLNRAPAADKVRELFGEERAVEFARVSDMSYLNVRRAAEDQGLGIDAAETAWKITRDVRDAAAGIASATPFSSEEGKGQLDALLAQARTRLAELLGRNV